MNMYFTIFIEQLSGNILNNNITKKYIDSKDITYNNFVNDIKLLQNNIYDFEFYHFFNEIIIL